MDENGTAALTSCLRVATILTIAMMTAVGFYVVLAATLVDRGAVPERLAGTLPALVPALLVVVAVLLVTAAQLLYRSQLGRLRNAADVGTPLAAYRRIHLVSLALSETAAIFGLVLTLLTGNLRWCFGVAAIALVSMAVVWPSRPQLRALLTAGEGAPIEPG